MHILFGWLGKNLWNIITWKKDFYSHLNIEDITDADYAHAKRVSKDFEIKNLGGYHDLNVQSNTLLLADAFENFRKIWVWSYKMLFSSWISLTSRFKKRQK